MDSFLFPLLISLNSNKPGSKRIVTVAFEKNFLISKTVLVAWLRFLG